MQAIVMPVSSDNTLFQLNDRPQVRALPHDPSYRECKSPPLPGHPSQASHSRKGSERGRILAGRVLSFLDSG